MLLIIGLLGTGFLSALLLAFVGGSADPVAALTPLFSHQVNSIEVIGDANLTDGICDIALDASADPPIPASGKCTWLAARQSVVGVPGDHTITFAFDITEVYRGAFSQPPDTGDREDPKNDKYIVTIQGPVTITFDEDPETFVLKQGLHFQNNYDGIFINEVWFKGDGTEALGFQDGGEGIRFGSNIDFFCTIATSHFTGLNRPFRLGVDAENNECAIVGNWVGFDPDLKPAGNHFGVEVEGNEHTILENRISGTTTGHALIVIGNQARIEDNVIGLDPSTNEALSNAQGVLINGNDNDFINNVVGATQGIGVQVFGDINSFYGNHIGTDKDGILDRGNGTGLVVNGELNCIGGQTGGDPFQECHAPTESIDTLDGPAAPPLEGNVISANKGAGVSISGSGNTVLRNEIGVGLIGPLPNRGDGVVISGNGNAVIDNLIVNNLGNGIKINSDSRKNVLCLNFIETDGFTDLGNQRHGVLIRSGGENEVGNTITGTLTGCG